MKGALAALALLTLAACQGDETVRAYGGGDRIWTLTELNGAPFPARATLRFPETGQIAGSGPCNSYFAPMAAPYPWFQTGPIGSTRMACPALKAEARYFDALAAATLVEVAGDTMILSNLDGLVMVFAATG